MVDTWKKNNLNNKSGFFKEFSDKNEAQEVADVYNYDSDYSFYNNRFVIKDILK